MSTLPTPGNGYAIDPGSFATVAFFQAVFSSVHARLNGVEAIAVDYDETIARLTTEALETVSATLSVEIADQRALLTGIQTSAEAVLAAYDQISLTGVPATQIRVAAMGGFDPLNVQAAFEAYQARLAGSDTVAADLATLVGSNYTATQSALDGRLRVDGAQGLTTTKQKRARDNIAAPSARQARARNRILDPGLQVSQQNGSASSNGSNLFYLSDTWCTQVIGGTNMTAARIAVPSPQGAPFRLRATNATPKASLAAGDFFELVHPIEGTEVGDSLFGTAGAKRLTFKFGCKMPAGTWAFRISNVDGSRCYVTTFTIAPGEAGVDVYRTIEIPGDITGAWAINSTAGAFYIQFILAAGSSWVGTNGWQGGNKLTTADATNFLGLGAGVSAEFFDFQLFVGLDAGEEPPPFELPSYADSLRACQRYFEIVPSWIVTDVSGPYLLGKSEQCKVTKRVNPSCSVKSYGDAGNGSVYPRSADALGVHAIYVRAQAVNGGASIGWNDEYYVSARM